MHQRRDKDFPSHVNSMSQNLLLCLPFSQTLSSPPPAGIRQPFELIRTTKLNKMGTFL